MHPACAEPVVRRGVGERMIRWWMLLFFFAPGVLMRADQTALLRQVVDAWLADRDRWAFTQTVKEYDGRALKEERVERYDPSRGYAARWELISINGRKPTPDELAEWTKRKNKKQRKRRADAAENFDFENAKVIEENARRIRYELPLRSGVEWLFPISKVELLLTIDKSGPALEQVQARISEPFRVALGLARILDVDLDVQMQPPPAADPADAKPSGAGQAVVTKFGDRVEYAWSDFERVADSAIEEERARALKSE